MTGLVYPRLPTSVAIALTEDLRTASSKGLEAVQAFISNSHPKAAPVPTGGQIATEVDVKRVRDAVMDSVGKWVDGRVLARGQFASFDGALGKTLHNSMQILPADAAHPEVWTFLTLVVLPDVAITRFPTMHQARMLGGQRNILRRAWSRYDALGDLLLQGPSPLGEDELVGLFERTAVARNRLLVRVLARTVLGYDGEMARSEYARKLYKTARHNTGPLMLDVLEKEAIEDLILGRSADSTTKA